LRRPKPTRVAVPIEEEESLLIVVAINKNVVA